MKLNVVLFGYLLPTLLDASASVAADKIQNGGFEAAGCVVGSSSGCAPWAFSGNSGVARVPTTKRPNNKAVTVGSGGSGDGSVSQDLKLARGNYSFSFQYRGEAGNYGDSVLIVHLGARPIFAATIRPGNSTWTKYKATIAVTQPFEGELKFEGFETSNPTAGPRVQIDNVHLVGP